MARRQLFHVGLGNEDIPKMGEIFLMSIELAKDHNAMLTIFTPVIKDFRGSFFSDVIGEQATRDLLNKKYVNARDISINLVSAKTIVPHREQGVVLGLWCSPDMLDTLDDCISAKEIIVVSYLPDEVSPWAAKHGITMS